MGKGLKGVLEFTAPLIDKLGEGVLYLREAWRREAKCGCGIDCCYGALVLTDQKTGEYVYIYIEDGAVKTTTTPKDDLVKVGSGVTQP